ncbi:hypothetical protein [uncultured Enterobacter sp.]|uniref:hypothetical protein n=1 Tax=uncultured Enterobacter sp. TaxID=238202 RepID=UPI0025F49896|nr:hypothetical protein [uncultured Enterobacter sp.]
MKPSYEELEQKLAESQREFRAADATIENLQMELNAEREAKLALAAENARCKFEISRCHQTVDDMFKNRERWMDKEWLSSIWSTSKRLMEETQATDAFLVEVRAQHLQSYADCIAARMKDKSLSMRQKELLSFAWAEVKSYAAELHNAQLRKGVQS